MKSTILIETHTIPAYRAIRPAVVASNVGTFGVSGLTFPPSKGARGITATINPKDFGYLVDVVNDAADNANVSREEYEIKTMHKISNPSKH